jgi:hypothetical protein
MEQLQGLPLWRYFHSSVKFPGSTVHATQVSTTHAMSTPDYGNNRMIRAPGVSWADVHTERCRRAILVGNPYMGFVVSKAQEICRDGKPPWSNIVNVQYCIAVAQLDCPPSNSGPDVLYL